MLFVNTFFQEMNVLHLVLYVSGALAASNNTSLKDLLQGYLTGQLASALGSYQVEALKREFKSFTGLMERKFEKFTEKTETEMNKIKGGTLTHNEYSKIKSIYKYSIMEYIIYSLGEKKMCLFYGPNK